MMKERTVVITGVSSGIGRATAKYLDARSFRVFGTVRKQEDADRLVAETSERFVPLIADLLDPDSIARSLEEVEACLGDNGLDGLVNNAGSIISTSLEFLDLDAFRRLLEVNVTGQLAVTQVFLPLIRKAQGRIVNMGSVSGISTLPTIGPYSATKFAMEALTDALRMELTPWGIHVSIIEPGSSSTAIMERAAETAKASEDENDPVRAGYTAMLRGMQAGFERSARGGIPPENVASRVHHALTARKPKTRYLVGRVAYLRSFARLLPDRLRDRLTLRALQKI